MWVTPYSLKDGRKWCRLKLLEEGMCPSFSSRDIVILKQFEKENSHCTVHSHKVTVLLWQQNDNEMGELSKTIKQKRQRFCPVYCAEVRWGLEPRRAFWRRENSLCPARSVTGSSRPQAVSPNPLHPTLVLYHSCVSEKWT